MAQKIRIKELQRGGQEVSVDANARCIRAPKDVNAEKDKGAEIFRDDGTEVHCYINGKKYRLETMELSAATVGEKICTKAGSSKLGSSFWPLFEVKSAPTDE